MKTVIIRGYYGRDNLGDELMKELFITHLKEEKVKLYIMNSAPDDLSEIYGIETPNELITGKVPSLKVFLKRLKTIVCSDLYVYGGGTILTDKHSYKHLIENCIYFWMRKFINKKSLLISVGATHFKTKIGKIACNLLIKGSTLSYIRDTDSFKLLSELTKNSKKLIQSADMVLLKKDDLVEEDEKTIDDRVAICIMPYYFSTYHNKKGDEKILEQLVQEFEKVKLKHPKLKFSIIPIQFGKQDKTDYDFSLELFEKLKEKYQIDIFTGKSSKEKIEELKKCKYLISMRLHALMLMKLMGKKVIAIDHNEKINYFMKRYDSTDNIVPFNEIGLLANKFENLFKDEIKDNKDNLLIDYELAKTNIDIIKKIIKDLENE